MTRKRNTAYFTAFQCLTLPFTAFQNTNGPGQGETGWCTCISSKITHLGLLVWWLHDSIHVLSCLQLMPYGASIEAEATASSEPCIQCPAGQFDHDAANGATSPGSACVDCPPDTFEDIAGSITCTDCPRGRVSPIGSSSLDQCTNTPDYRGCYSDRETISEGRDLTGARTTMSDGVLCTTRTASSSAYSSMTASTVCHSTVDASPARCSEFCRSAGFTYMGLQWTSLCFCDNSFGSYSRLPDEACGTVGDACGQNNTEQTNGLCSMRNAIFKISAPWTCENVTCTAGTAKIPSLPADTVPNDSDADAQLACCSSTCAEWSADATNVCTSGTHPIQSPAADAAVAGLDPQESCCTGICSAGTWRDVRDGHCHWCPAGKMSSADDATECSDCGTGTYARIASTACAACAEGQFDADQDASTRCGICPAGTESAAGSTGIDDCTERVLSAGADGAGGCTDAAAANYDAAETVSDGSCEYDCLSLAGGGDARCLIFGDDGLWHSELAVADAAGGVDVAASIVQMLDLAPPGGVIAQGYAHNARLFAALGSIGVTSLKDWKPDEIAILNGGPPEDPACKLAGCTQSMVSIDAANDKFVKLVPIEDLKYTASGRRIDIDGDLSDWQGLAVEGQTPFQADGKGPQAWSGIEDSNFQIFENAHGQSWYGIYDHSLAMAAAWEPENIFIGVSCARARLPLPISRCNIKTPC